FLLLRPLASSSQPLVGRVVVIVAVFALLAFAVTGCNRVGSGSEASRECRGLAHLAEAAQKFSAFLTEKNPDPNTFIKEFHDFAAFKFLDLVSRVPIEIRPDVRVLDDAFVKYVDVISNLRASQEVRAEDCGEVVASADRRQRA